MIIVGEFGLIISGTDSTDSIVTNDSTSPTSSVPRTCGSTMSMSTRNRRAPRLRAASMCCSFQRRHRAGQQQRDERRLLPHEGDDDAAPVEHALRRERLDQPGADEHVVEHAVLGEERAHHLPGDDERDEQRPAIEPAQDRDRARILAERQIAGDRDGDEPDQHRRQERRCRS